MVGLSWHCKLTQRHNELVTLDVTGVGHDHSNRLKLKTQMGSLSLSINVLFNYLALLWFILDRLAFKLEEIFFGGACLMGVGKLRVGGWVVVA